MGRKSRERREQRAKPIPSLAIFVALAVLTLAVFGQVADHAFLNYDDGQFVTENPHVAAGLTGSSMAWAITSASTGWYPLTWLSHELDVTLWGMRAGMHLLTNVVLHLASACVLFVALRRMTASTWASAVVAALFAIHPMHVESVAWVSERKDTLSTLFAMLALLAYASDRPRRMLWVFVLMALSLMAKQMAVTLPFVLILLDWWRFREVRIREKLPLIALSIAGGVAAVIGQRQLDALRSLEAVPLSLRIENALTAYVRYVAKLIAPMNLAPIYPLRPVATWLAIALAVMLVALSVAAWRLRNTRPHLFAGWFWFVGTLVPVIGIVQIGPQSMADRYTYFPAIGLFIAVAFSVPEAVLRVAGIAIVTLFAVVANRQAAFWRDSETLFTRTVAVTRDNPLAEYLLGQTLEMSDPERAIAHLRRAIDLAPTAHYAPNWCSQPYVGLGTAMLAKAQSMPPGEARTALILDAVAQLRHALALDPNAPHAKNNLAVAHSWLAAERH